MAHDTHAHADGEHGHHLIPMSVLLKTFGGLIFLTILTVYTATQLDLGAFDVPVALTIAICKATLVVMFFMGLKYDNRVNTLVLILGILFVMIFISFTLFDTAFRGDIGNVGEDTVEDITLEAERLQLLDPGQSGLVVTPADSLALQGQDPSQADTTAAPADTTSAPTEEAEAPAETPTDEAASPPDEQ